jgi:hypothetical protein
VDDNEVLEVRATGLLTLPDLLILGRWKSTRILGHLATNDAAFVETVTACALTTPDERLRIAVLRLLAGVDWPVASVLPHFGHRTPYTILDVRALWALGVEPPLRATRSPSGRATPRRAAR